MAGGVGRAEVAAGQSISIEGMQRELVDVHPPREEKTYCQRYEITRDDTNWTSRSCTPKYDLSHRRKENNQAQNKYVRANDRQKFDHVRLGGRLVIRGSRTLGTFASEQAAYRGRNPSHQGRYAYNHLIPEPQEHRVPKQ